MVQGYQLCLPKEKQNIRIFILDKVFTSKNIRISMLGKVTILFFDKKNPTKTYYVTGLQGCMMRINCQY